MNGCFPFVRKEKKAVPDMASPVGHSLIALSVFTCSQPCSDLQKRTILTVVSLGSLADIDFVFHFLFGLKFERHSATHSILFIVICLVVLCLKRIIQKDASSDSEMNKVGLSFTAVLLILSSHLALDALGEDGSFPYGIQLFWPISGEYFIFPASILPGVSQGSWSELISRSNVELILLGTIVWGSVFWGCLQYAARQKQRMILK